MLSVAVVEPDPNYQHSSAPRSAGGVRQQFSLAPNIELSQYGIAFLRSVGEVLQVPGSDAVPDVQLKEQGYLFLASDAGTSTLQQNHATQQSVGARTSILEKQELANRFPWLNLDGIALGCFGDRDEGWFDPFSLQMALRAKARDMGVDFIHGRVTGFDCTRPSGSTETKVITAVDVHTTTGEQRRISAGHVVNAAGAFAGQLVGFCGAGVAPLPVHARKRFIFSFHVAPPDDPAVLLPPSDTTPLVSACRP